MITGNKLLDWGFIPGKFFGQALVVAKAMELEGYDENTIWAKLVELQPKEQLMRTNSIPYNIFLEPESDDERANLVSVSNHMDALLRVPTIVKAAIMPDACPAGSELGTIPVGGVVATKDAIHPGFHSADICCSMAMTVFNRGDDPKRILDVAQKITHFGKGRREKYLGDLTPELAERILNNSFLSDLGGVARGSLSTQGDGNHFLYLGERESDGKLALVTHHGSRNFGAILYKKGMAAAKRHTRVVAPKVPEHNAWLDANSDEGREYWEALQIIRDWTKINHFSIHDEIASVLGNRIIDRTWNEHNFVFRRDDGLYYHGKGATPSYKGFSPDEDGRTLIPMNMSEPILITEHVDNKDALGFAPHGAGRNMSRTKYMKDIIGDRTVEEVMEEQTKGLDIRFYTGRVDLSELPAAYKNAENVRKSIEKFNLTNVVDQINPIGSIMAGNEDRPWLNKKKK